MNVIILHGHIGFMSELRYVGKDEKRTPLVEFTLATNEFRGGAKLTTWHTCKAFGKMAETIHRYCEKGRELMVLGRRDDEKWEGKDGTKHQRSVVRVREIDFAGPSKIRGKGDPYENRTPSPSTEEAAAAAPTEPQAHEGGPVDDSSQLPF